MKVDLDDLHKLCDILFQHIKEKGLDSIFLDVDYYWNISKDQLYNPYEQPSEMDLGQLSDDWNELQKILQAQKEPLGYDLVWLAAILRAVGEKAIL